MYENSRDKLINSKWFTPPKPRKKKSATDPTSESNIQKAIMEYLSIKGVFFWRNNSGMISTQATAYSKGRFVRFGAVGSPDLICCIDGILVGIEVKTAKGKLSENQEKFRDRLISAGGRYIVARSIDDVIEGLAY